MVRTKFATCPAPSTAVELNELFTAQRQLASRKAQIHKWPNRRHSMRQQSAELRRLQAKVEALTR